MDWVFGWLLRLWFVVLTEVEKSKFLVHVVWQNDYAQHWLSYVLNYILFIWKEVMDHYLNAFRILNFETLTLFSYWRSCSLLMLLYLLFLNYLLCSSVWNKINYWNPRLLICKTIISFSGWFCYGDTFQTCKQTGTYGNIFCFSNIVSEN